MDAGDYNVAIAFQEPSTSCRRDSYYESLAEMYVGTDVSPDFYAWVFLMATWLSAPAPCRKTKPDQGPQVGIRHARKRLIKGEVIKVGHPILSIRAPGAWWWPSLVMPPIMSPRAQAGI